MWVKCAEQGLSACRVIIRIPSSSTHRSSLTAHTRHYTWQAAILHRITSHHIATYLAQHVVHSGTVQQITQGDYAEQLCLQVNAPHLRDSKEEIEMRQLLPVTFYEEMRLFSNKVLEQ